MTLYGLGARGRRVFDALHQRIQAGELSAGARLPSHLQLAEEFGVAPMTVRAVLAQLEAAGLVSRQSGRGTFVLSPAARLLLLARADLIDAIGPRASAAGLAPIVVESAQALLDALQGEHGAVRVLVELSGAAIELVRIVRRRWPAVPLGVIAPDVVSLAPLYGTPEWPHFILSEPVSQEQLDPLFRSTGATDVAATSPTDFDAWLSVLPEPALVIERQTGRVRAWNGLAERLLGEKPARALGRTLSGERSEGAPADPAVPIEELSVTAADGRQLWLQVASARLQPELVVVLLHDYTAQHTASTWQAFQSRLLDAVEQAIVATDPFAHVLYWNRGAEQLYGWRSEEVLGKNLGDVIVAPELMQAGREIMARLRRGESWFGEFLLRRRDGSEIPVLVTDSPIRDSEGQLIGIIGVSLDISERKQAELDHLERIRLESQLHATTELSRELLSSIPTVGKLATDPRLPSHLRPTATTLLQSIQQFAAHLETPS